MTTDNNTEQGPGGSAEAAGVPSVIVRARADDYPKLLKSSLTATVADYPADAQDEHHRYSELAVPLETVKDNIRRYGLLDDQVQFLGGWLSDTPAVADPARRRHVQVDDRRAREPLPQLSAGGFVVIDDGALAPCRQAVDDYRSCHRIDDPIEWTDWSGFLWHRGVR